MSNTLEFLRFPPLGSIDKLRLGWTIWLRLAASRTGSRSKQVPVADWLARHSGRRTFEQIWLPLLQGQARRRLASAPAPRSSGRPSPRMYAARRTGLKKEMFGYVPGGYARILRALREQLRGAGRRDPHRLPRVERCRDADGDVRRVARTAGERLAFDRVVVTTPRAASRPGSARSCRPTRTTRLNGVEYLGIVCASLLLKKPLAGYYVTNITDAGAVHRRHRDDGARRSGRVRRPARWSTCRSTSPPDDPPGRRADDEIRERVPGRAGADVPALHARRRAGVPRLARAARVRALDARLLAAACRRSTTSVPGLFLVNSAQIVNGTLNVNETVRLAEAVAGRRSADRSTHRHRSSDPRTPDP